jgi:hypothetical protein
VLHQRELVLIVAEIVQDTLHEARRNLAAADRHRTRDRGAQRVARHAADQIQPGIHGLGQPGVVHAVADEVRPHRQGHVDRELVLADSLEEGAHERDRLVARLCGGRIAPEAEQLFELIDENEQIVIFRQPRLAYRVHQPVRPAAEGRVHQHLVGGREFLVRDPEHIPVRQCRGEVPERILPRPQDGHAPAGAGADEIAGLQGRDETGAYEGRFAAPRGTDDRQEAVRPQPAQQLVDLLFTAEEQVLFVRLEGAQSGKWIKQTHPL